MIFGDHDDATLAQFDDVKSRAVRAALMADGHRGYVMPIGGVSAYRNRVSIPGVGVDIGCGNAAIRTDLSVEQVFGLGLAELTANPHRFQSNRSARAIADEVFDELSLGVGGTNRHPHAPRDHELFRDPAWWSIPNEGGYRDTLMETAREQLGTTGGGNHYADIFADERGRIWVGVHFGSRGFGFTVANNMLAIAQGGRWGDRPDWNVDTLADLDTAEGSDYWALMTLAGEYAYAGREWAARTVVRILGGEEVELVHNHHNFAWAEEHAGEELIVVRKGATPAFPGQKGFVGGSMGDDAVILEGADPDDAAAAGLQQSALFSTVHGAGRVMGRREAAGKWKRGKLVRKGRLTLDQMNAWLAKRGVVLRGGDLEEAPQVYRRLPDVLDAQGPTINVLHTLRPLIVCMAPGRAPPRSG